MVKKKRFFYRLLLGANLVFALLLVLTMISYFFEVYGLSSVLSLTVPYLLLVHVFFVCLWIFKGKKFFLLSLGILFVSYFVFGSPFKIGLKNENLKTKNDIRVLTYNAWGFNKNEWIKKPNIGDKIIDFIGQQNPDILCVQEHSRIRYQQLRQYKYRSETPHTPAKSIQAIFSKFPIIQSGSLNLPETTNNVIFADILIDKDTIRVYNIHLESFKIIPNTEILTEERETKRTFKKIGQTFKKQQEQAGIIRKHMDNNHYRKIVMGDFNNTQFSNVYRTIKEDLQDSFLEKGSGLGKTYQLLGFPMRIDHIFADDTFEFTSHSNFDVKLSDHYPVMATLRLRHNETTVD